MVFYGNLGSRQAPSASRGTCGRLFEKFAKNAKVVATSGDATLVSIPAKSLSST